MTWLTSTTADEKRVQALDGAKGIVRKQLQLPASEASMDRIYIGDLHQAEIHVEVDFHLGSKVRQSALMQCERSGHHWPVA